MHYKNIENPAWLTFWLYLNYITGVYLRDLLEEIDYKGISKPRWK